MLKTQPIANDDKDLVNQCYRIKFIYIRILIESVVISFGSEKVYSFVFRQTMYDFVNDWSPEPFGLHHQGVWSKRSNCLGGAWRVITQTKDCLMSEHLDENNCKCTSHAKTARRRRLRSKSGFYLTVMPNGQVLGVKDPTNCYSK